MKRDCVEILDTDNFTVMYYPDDDTYTVSFFQDYHYVDEVSFSRKIEDNKGDK